MQYPYAEFQNIMYLLPILKMKRKFDTSVSTVPLSYINIAAMYGRNQTWTDIEESFICNCLSKVILDKRGDI